MIDISEKLKFYFKQQHITQMQLAEILGCSQSYVNSLLTGKKEFGKGQAKRFEELFGISETWLLTGKGDMMIKGVVQNNHNGNNINHGNVTLEDSSANKFIALLQKKDEQIDRLLAIIEKIQTP